MKKIILYILLFFSAFISCKDDEITTDPRYRLEYSKDTISFDTILGGITTPYQTLKVYNKSGERIKISSINYASSHEYFMVNINGRNTHNLTDIELPNGDSLYIFVQTNGECSDSELPFSLLDSISFSYNGNLDHVYLSAFSETPIILDHFIVSSDTTLSGTQPYLIKDTLKVEEGVTLNIDAGVRLFFHNSASIYVDGMLNCNGTVDNQIEMRYFRSSPLSPKFFPDTKYYLAPGNWRGVQLSQKSGDCKFLSTNIIGAYRSLQVDSAFVDRNVEIGNCQIYNAKQGVLRSEASQIYAYNTVFANGGYYNVYLIDGKYLFNHCTVVSYLSFNLADKKPALYLQKKDSISVEINNSIVCGNYTSSGSFGHKSQNFDLDNVGHCLKDSVNGTTFRLDIACSVLSREDSLVGGNNYGNKWNVRPEFDRTQDFYIDFKSDSTSFRTVGSDAILKLYPECATDILGKSRVDDFMPDAGAYEY